MTTTLPAIETRRARHRERSLAIRVLAGIAGTLLGLAGVVLVLPLPEAGIPALLGGLRLLALEFDWAARAQGWVDARWAQFRAWFRRQDLVVRVALPVALAALLVGAALLAF